MEVMTGAALIQPLKATLFSHLSRCSVAGANRISPKRSHENGGTAVWIAVVRARAGRRLLDTVRVDARGHIGQHGAILRDHDEHPLLLRGAILLRGA